MPLRKSKKSAQAASEANVGDKKSKRQRLVAFLRIRRKRQEEHEEKHKEKEHVVPIPLPTVTTTPRKSTRDSKLAELTPPAKSSSSVAVVKLEAQQAEQTPQSSGPPTPTPEPKEKEPDKDKAEKVETLTEEHVHALFSGAPHFTVKRADNQQTPRALFPWNDELKVKDVSDSTQLAHPAFSAATLHRHLPSLQQSDDQDKIFQGYDVGVLEVPSMLSAQGIEPGTIGFAHFLELSKSDNLVTDLQQTQSSNGYLEAMRNKEQMQSDPERLGIRRVNMAMVHDRLIELGDLFEAFQDSPERITILNNQSSGDLYANLFGKFLSPPKYDDAADDPLGLKVQIDTLLKILGLKGVWYDFSLVEWRIRLGQILWSDGEALPEHEPHQLWLEREILLLQITLSCELLLRLDAVSSMDTDYVKGQMHVTPEDYKGFLNLKTRKTDWDMILARRFLENILVIKESDTETLTQTPKPRGLLSMLSREDPEPLPIDDIILLPRHQARQLSGLVHFAETIQWPEMNLLKELAQKLGITDSTKAYEQLPSPYGKFLEPSTPSSISVYGTPLATPRSTVTVRDSYFGNITKPALSRNNSKVLTIPLSPTLLTQAGPSAANAMNVGGWLSRSYLTGLVLPGEGISHFLMSTILENDKLAVAALGDSANLYGGFVYSEKSWWSKSSIIGRVLACMEGSQECMGWITITNPPEALDNGWYALNSAQISSDRSPRIEAEEDLVARDSAVIPNSEDEDEDLNPDHLTLPVDSATLPIPSVQFTGWNLTPTTSTDLSDTEGLLGSPSETETSYTAAVSFKSHARGTTHTITLAHDVQFITSFPCTPPASSPIFNLPQVLNPSPRLARSPSTLSTSRLSRAMTLNRRNSHGFEPLFSHPPDSPSIEPMPAFNPLDAELEGKSKTKSAPMMAHPLHTSYKYKIVPVTGVLDPSFVLPYNIPPLVDDKQQLIGSADENCTLVLDARASKDLELLARAWCAEKGLHAIVGRVGRSCLACCVREARGLGVKVVVRV